MHGLRQTAAMNKSIPQSEKSEDVLALLNRLLAITIQQRASDLHLSAEHPPYLRLQGILAPLDDEPQLLPATLEKLADHLSQGFNIEALKRTGSLDGALSAGDGSRFRYNVYRRGGQYSIALRRLEDHIRPLSELGLPDSLYRLSDLSDGLVLLAGPTGCGKSTTLATLIDRINRNRRCHIVTIEDPIEYVHPSRLSLVNQRQIGTDASNFNDALVASLRQDPDVILVGEIRDLDTIRTAITAAETGHLVFTTVHAPDCVGSIDRLATVFPADEQPGIRRQLSMILRAVISQHLIVADGNQAIAAVDGEESPQARLVLASEVLQVNSAVANLIANSKDTQIYSMMETGTGEGMYTMDECLARLWSRGAISERTAAAMAHNPRVMTDRARRMGLRNRATSP